MDRVTIDYFYYQNLLMKENVFNDLERENRMSRHRINKAIKRISLIRMDGDTSIETHKALDEILNILRGSDK